MKIMYRANLELRTALRILMPIHRFEAFNEDDFYRGVRSINWSAHMDVKQTLATDAVGSSEIFRSSHYLGLLAKDAICDHFRHETQRRPNVRVEMPDLRIHIHYFHEKITVCLDSSDESLHLRGWRREAVAAPLNEVLAAGMLKLAGWTPDRTLIDPMCGSGTLLIEAAMVATDTAANFYRPTFGFFRWKKFDEKIWKDVYNEAKKRIKPATCLLLGFDIDQQARNISRVNTMSADSVGRFVTFEKMAFEKLSPTNLTPKKVEATPALGKTGTGFYDTSKPSEPLFLEKIAQNEESSAPKTPMLIFNPPYDERLKMEDIGQFYAAIGERMKHHWSGWEAWIISSNREAMHQIGLRPTRKITLNNGGLECSFQQFQLYEGTKRRLVEE
jgi:putative N6-adenine-specific DNA methylase